MTKYNSRTQEWRTLTVAHEFDIPDRRTPERLVSRIAEAGKRRFVDIRVFRLNTEAEEFRPTSRGVCLPVECTDELQLAAMKLVEAGEEL